MPRYLIGLDLGTTNSALAYTDLERPARADGRIDLRPFPLPQLVAPGDTRDRPLLPSFLYLPGPHDLAPGSTALPWDAARDFAVGEFARNHGGKIPGRLVSSAKSWLCHAGVDRSAPLLPWTAPPDVPRISPVEASARYLRHMAEAWNFRVAKTDPSLRIEKQEVVLTVPASFDDVARTLTVDAAKKAGFENVTLLEEPQAAFYCWLATHPPAELNALKPGSLCVVVDVGGGTTDFSLIRAVEDKGELGFVRQAVGDHLLLGGDNMDLALARHVEAKLPQAGKLDAAQYGLLTQACRAAKEVLLSPNPPAAQTVTVVGRGRSVIGGTLHTPLTTADVQKVIFDGFFPQSALGDRPDRAGRAGLSEMGLPYVADPAVTRHLAAFLASQGVTAAPEAILFNGGVFTPASLRERLVSVMSAWYGPTWKPLILTNPSLDLAVAWGAAFYGWLRHTGGKRIGGGIPRSYYVALGGAEGDAKAKTVVCVVPQQLEEGQELSLPRPELELSLGVPVVFPLHSSTVRGDDKAGDVLTVSSDQLSTLPPLTTVLRGGKRAGVKDVPVTLASRLSAIGTMELFCVAKDGGNRWKLEFNIRELVKEAPPKDDVEDADAGVGEVWLEDQVEAAALAIRRVFGAAQPPMPPQELPKALETALDATRHEWPTGLCRRLWDYLAETAEARRESPAHLMRWYNLAGHVLRPGFGDALDRHRLEQLWKIVAAPPKVPGQTTTRAVEGGADFWVLWRRVAGGLNGAVQQALFDRMRAVLVPTKGKNVIRPQANELAEMWRCAASLERLDVRHKENLGFQLLPQVKRSPVPGYAYWSLTRIGARSLVAGPLNAVVHPQIVEKWIEALLETPPESESDAERPQRLFCLCQMARMTGQRAIDIDEALRGRVLETMRSQGANPAWVEAVEKVTEQGGEEQKQILGDSLPIGLRLRDAGGPA